MDSNLIYTNFTKYIAKNMNLSLYNILFKKGDKQYLFDYKNKKYLDMFSGASTAILGYNNKEIINTYVNICSKLHHTCSVYSPTIEIVELAEKIIKLIPNTYSNKVIFGLSGSDAIDCALKAVRKFNKRKNIFCFERAYHGSCGLSTSATNWESLRRGLTLDQDFTVFPYPFTEDQGEYVIQSIVDVANKEVPSAIIIEPIQGDGGMFTVNKNFMRELSDFCKKREIVLIFDEIQSGMGRTGKWWSYEYLNVFPDITIIGKSITAGYAVLSAVVGRAEILDILDKGQHVFTYSANPAACGIAKIVIDIIERENYLDKNIKKGDLLMTELNNINSPLIKEVRGNGLMVGIEIDKYKDFNAGLIGLRCAEKGVYFGYYGQNNEILRIHPPYIIEKKDVYQTCEVLEETLTELTSGTISKISINKFKKECIGLGNS